MASGYTVGERSWLVPFPLDGIERRFGRDEVFDEVSWHPTLLTRGVFHVRPPERSLVTVSFGMLVRTIRPTQFWGELQKLRASPNTSRFFVSGKNGRESGPGLR